MDGRHIIVVGRCEGFEVPTGPKGEKRPADLIGAAIMVAKIATGEIEETIEDDGKDPAATALGKKGRARSL